MKSLIPIITALLFVSTSVVVIGTQVDEIKINVKNQYKQLDFSIFLENPNEFLYNNIYSPNLWIPKIQAYRSTFNLRNYIIKLNDLNYEKRLSIQVSKGKILYVGGSGEGNYTKIQDAIDNASDGDTVFVYSGEYNENVGVNVSINLIGEDKNTTQITGGILISDDGVSVSGFTIYRGLNLNSSNGNNIVGNSIWGCSWGLCPAFTIKMSCNNIISGNNIEGGNGIIMSDASNNNTLSNNNINGLYWEGLAIYDSCSNIITGNNISYNGHAAPGGCGFQLIDSSYHIISDNNISGNFGGLFLDNCVDNIIYNNIICDNGGGLGLINCVGNIISGNNISNNGFWSTGGLFLDNCDNNNISDNLLCSNLLGLEYSRKNEVSGNTFFNNGLWVFYSHQNDVDNNTVNEKPLVYLEDKSDLIITDAGQVILVNCNNITVENLNFSNVFIGIELWGTNNCKIKDNYCSKNEMHGIYFGYSDNNTITGNNFSNNEYSGIFGAWGSSNTIISNTISSNQEYGIGFSGIKNNITDNIISNNDEGIHLHITTNNTITSNIISVNEDKGVYLFSSNNNAISDNNISTNKYGIHLDISHNNSIAENIIWNNHKEGVLLKESNYSNIARNKISNSEFGISLSNSYSNTIEKNNFFENKEDSYFKYKFLDLLLNRNQWRWNFWNEPKLAPKLIFGNLIILSKEIFWINFDWRPALKPYDI